MKPRVPNFITLMVTGFQMEPLYILWMFGIDGPHVLATVPRTYFDKEELSRLGMCLWMLIRLLLIGPLAVSGGYTLLFYLFAICWQHFHIVKQYSGCVMLHKAKKRHCKRRTRCLSSIGNRTELVYRYRASDDGSGCGTIEGPCLGFAFTHYVLDARIWHLRNDKGLARALHMD